MMSEILQRFHELFLDKGIYFLMVLAAINLCIASGIFIIRLFVKTMNKVTKW